VPASTPPPPYTPPYSLAPLRFPFRALAEQAANARIGGAREVALACLVAARLADSAPLSATLPASARTARATAARAWFASLALPAALRAPLDRLCGVAAEGDGERAGAALASVLAAAKRQLGPASVAELERVVRALQGSERREPPRLAAAGGGRIFEPCP
jgi:hypothetical protein